MLKFFKWLVYLVLLTLVLLIGAGAALLLLVDPNDYKDEIVAVVEKQTGRQLTIEGELGLSFYPWLGFETGAMELSNAEGFGAQPFARVEQVDVGVKLIPLLDRRIETRTVVLRGLHLNLMRDKSGHSNWDDLVAEKTPAAKPAPSEQSAGPSGMIGAVVIGGVQIEDAQINWDDRGTGEHYTLSGVNLKTDTLSLNEPFNLDFGMDVASPAVSGHLALNTRVHANLDAQLYRLENAKLQADLKSGTLPQPLNLDLNTDVQADLKEGSLRLDNIQVGMLGVEAQGAIKGAQMTTHPSFSGKLAVKPFSPRELMQKLGQPIPETAGADALNSAEADLSFTAGTNAVDVKDLRVKLDQSTLSGTAQVKNFASPRIGFDLALDTIDLDAYLPPKAEGEAAPATPAETAAGATAQLPLDTLRALNLNGELKIGSLKVDNLKTRDVSVKIAAAGGLIRIAPIEAQLYDGQYAGSARLDARSDTLRTQVQWNLAGIQAGPLLQDLTGEDRLLGTGDVEANLSAEGSDPATLRRTLNGAASFKFNDGAVKGINIAHLLRKAKAAVTGGAPPPEEYNKTDFSTLSASFQIEDGIISNSDLQGKSPLLRVEGEGRIDLPQEALDYNLSAVLVGTLTGQGGKELQELQGVPIPIRITGGLSQPKIALDLEKIIKERAKAELEKRLEGKQGEIQKKVEEKLGGELEKKLGEGAKEELQKKLPGALKGLFSQ